MGVSDLSNIIVTVAIVQVVCDVISYWRVFSKDSYQRVRNAFERSKFKYRKTLQDVGGDVSSSSAAAAATKETGGGGKKEKSKGGGGGGGAGGSKKSSMNAKRLQRAKDDHSDAAANVARKHTAPSVLTSFAFLLLMKILATEYKGKIVALVPFVPFRPLKRYITGRNLDIVTIPGVANHELVQLFEEEHAAGGGGVDAANKVTTAAQCCSFLIVYLLCTLSVKFYVNKVLGTHPPKNADSIMSIVNSPMGHKFLRKIGIDPNDLQVE